jgi:hypothetical protein
LARVDDLAPRIGELDALSCHRIEINPGDDTADYGAPDVPVSPGRHGADRLHGVHADDSGDSDRDERGDRRGDRLRTIVRRLAHTLRVTSVLTLRISASLSVPVAMVLVIPACETIAIAAPVFSLIVLGARRHSG